MNIKNVLTILLFFLFLLSVETYGQDERLFRDIILSEQKEVFSKQKEIETYLIRAQTPMYEIDINEDGVKEGIVYEKEGGRNYIIIYTGKKKILKKFELDIFGMNASLYRIVFKRISNLNNVLLLYFFAGASEYLEYQGKGKLYIINIIKKKSHLLTITNGPTFWDEYQDRKNNYYRRKYNLEAIDLNNDGIKELVLRFSKISKVCRYSINHTWTCY